MLVIQLKKTEHNTTVTEIENKLTDHNHDKYITTSEINTLAADVFNARFAKANLITKTDFDVKLSRINRKITENKTENVIIKNQLNKLKTFLTRAILLARVILKKMVLKTIQYFSQ